MKIIDLLNKIANGEEVPKKIKYCNEKFEFTGYDSISQNYKNELEDLFEVLDGSILNDEVEILDENKENGLPEKLPYYSLEKIQKAKNKDEWIEERISLLENKVEDLHNKMNILIDYLETKAKSVKFYEDSREEYSKGESDER